MVQEYVYKKQKYCRKYNDRTIDFYFVVYALTTKHIFISLVHYILFTRSCFYARLQHMK